MIRNAFEIQIYALRRTKLPFVCDNFVFFLFLQCGAQNQCADFPKTEKKQKVS